MSKGTKIILGLFISFILVIGISIAWLINIKFEAQSFENQLVSNNQNMQNVYSSVDKILLNSGITVKNFGETKIKAIQESVKKYADKPELISAWVQENPQQIDSKLWENFQKQIEVQYTKFEMEQKAKISQSQAYNDFLKTTLRGQVAQIVWSYPTAGVTKIMEQVIQTDVTKQSFDTGIDTTRNVLDSK